MLRKPPQNEILASSGSRRQAESGNAAIPRLRFGDPQDPPGEAFDPTQALGLSATTPPPLGN